MVLTISNKGWVVIPAELRKKYNLHAGSEVVIVDYGGVLAIIPAAKYPVKQGRGFLAGASSASTDLKKDRKLEKKRDARLANE
ncbi:MAG TPA: AbrB/MazE/SpoVT family DNA-binding domain-containing protein [Anaerolineales bacterium]|nr:AbrB/MazE/SpoVT family DNA-binding domain-containing protein [Anaerolineales bacterium]HNF35836.1 AbrB/MazE/SpoVT family DNA-binding domain-containing protein [Anaerolineales bacterium]HNH77101.1 AbrB/MazE/SpoVT family DNA-binding domain-containing protein [Anaerolineales bacterium]